ncbi:DUF2750 domain-containing protein [Actinomadura scrupuli]|uniref:DUF2750 domain-containing protein n=1 Tax=Actinomadura scrupuli TaxID=559629 RepID=UPI003D999E15
MGSQSAAQASAFFREVARERRVWGVRDDEGFPAFQGGSGELAMPFWSLESRAARIVEICPAYASFRAAAIPLAEWIRWLPDLRNDGLGIGVNWSGPRARGWDFTVSEVLNRLQSVSAGLDPTAVSERAPRTARQASTSTPDRPSGNGA